MVFWKIVSVLTKFWESSPGKNLVCYYGISFFWKIFMCSDEIFDKKIVCLLMIISPPGKLYVFLRNWESSLCVLLHFASPGKFTYVLVLFCFSWKSRCVLIKELCLLLENSYVFLLHPSLMENLMCFRNLFKKVTTTGKKEQIF